MIDIISCTNGYKLDHRRQYPKGTEFVKTVFANGKLVREYTLEEIRHNVNRSLV